MNLINYYKPLTYNELEKWYCRIINLQEIRDIGCEFSIKNLDDDIYGQCSSNGDIDINISNQPNLAHLVLTIAHEIAHLEEFNHSNNHKKLTKEIINYIKKQLNKTSIDVSEVTSKAIKAIKSSNSIDDIYNKLIRR